MNSLNKVQIIGNLTANPEVRETPNGQKVASFSVATNRVWKDTAGMKQEQVEYHNIVAWRGLAGIAEQYLAKGKKVYIEGYLQTRSWDDQAGQKKYRTEIVCDNLIMLSGGAGAGSDDMEMGYSAPEAGAAPAKSKKAPKIEEEIHIEDIPF
jgi:single-strand DNA-binding protein